MKPLHIGIAACSAEGAALCYRTICTEAPALLGAHDHPEVTMHTPSLDQYMQHIYRDDWKAVGEMMLASAEKLQRVGADFVICPDNTIHQALPYEAIRKTDDKLIMPGATKDALKALPEFKYASK